MRFARQHSSLVYSPVRAMKRSNLLLAAAVALALSACEGNNSTQVDSGSGHAESRNSTGATEDHARGMATTLGERDSPAGVGLPESAGTATFVEADRKALLTVMEVDRHEISAAEMALAKNVQGEVRAYAEALLQDHTRNLEATRSLLGPAADATGEAMTTVAGGTAATTETAAGDADAHRDLAEVKQKHDAEREHLQTLSGAGFQKAWIDAMVKGHAEALAKLDDALIPDAKDDRVRSHLQTTRSAIAGHLESARGLQ